MEDVLTEKPNFTEFPQQTLDMLHSGLQNNKRGQDYFLSRNIVEESWNYFYLGYSDKHIQIKLSLP